MSSRIAITTLLFGTCLIASTSGKGIIDSRLQARFLPGGGSSDGTQNVMVSFTQSISSVIDQINGQSFSSQDDKRSALTQAQKTFTDGVQGGLKSFLDGQGVKSESFWISNQMIVQDASQGLVNAIANFPGVEKVEEEPVMELKEIDDHVCVDESNNGLFNVDGGNFTEHVNGTVAWGVELIGGSELWGMNMTGEGVVVANIDTGVRYTHEALRGNWREEYGWFDAVLFTQLPNDFNGHGTHTMGTIAGQNGIGVAPMATWIACKGCSNFGCQMAQLLACGQWMQCPWKAFETPLTCNSSMAPSIVSNSWGMDSGTPHLFDLMIQSWRAAGIIPVFAIGNSGPRCNTAGSPGSNPRVISVGSTDKDEKVSEFSSRGPGYLIFTKPDIVAPGRDIVSAWHTGDSVYRSLSGTSMACPHVSGVIALMMEKRADLDYNQIYNALTNTTDTSGLDTSMTLPCGGISVSQYPNNVAGYGRVNAVRALNAIE